MKRTIISLLLVAISVTVISALCVFAYNCGDTWQPSGPVTFDKTCPNGSTPVFTQTAHWRIFWVDGYERNDVLVSEKGQCKGTYANGCYPAFETPILV